MNGIARRMSKTALVGAVLAAALIGVAGTASADGPDGINTWTNKATGGQLYYNTNCGCVSTAQGAGVNDSYGQWSDYNQGDGTFTEANEGENANWCLDSNQQWDNGHQGNVYTTPCNPASTGNLYQHWYEIPTSNGWALQDRATHLYLDGGGGPANQGVYTNGAYGLGNNYQHWT